MCPGKPQRVRDDTSSLAETLARCRTTDISLIVRLAATSRLDSPWVIATGSLPRELTDHRPARAAPEPPAQRGSVARRPPGKASAARAAARSARRRSPVASRIRRKRFRGLEGLTPAFMSRMSLPPAGGMPMRTRTGALGQPWRSSGQGDDSQRVTRAVGRPGRATRRTEGLATGAAVRAGEQTIVSRTESLSVR